MGHLWLPLNRMRKHLIAVGIGSVIGCVLTYLASLQGYSPENAGGYSQWGIPFQWHSIGTGTGGLTIGAYRYVVLSNLALDLIFWSVLSIIALGVVLSVERQNHHVSPVNSENDVALS